MRLNSSPNLANDRKLRDISDGLLRNALTLTGINRNGFPELYLTIRTNDNPPRMQLLAYSVNCGKSMSDIYLVPLASKPEHAKGCRGWNQFAVVESSPIQRFPVFTEGAANNEPTSVRQIRYRLRPGEANWQLVADKVDES